MTGPLLYINPSAEIPIFRQIIRQITDAIAGGKVEPGQRLPSHRELSAQLVIAPLTVKKAYDELEREGLITTQRGRGTFVSKNPPVSDPKETRERLREPAQQLLSRAALSGVSFSELLDLLKELQERMKR